MYNQMCKKEWGEMFLCFNPLTIMKTRLFKYIENFTSKNWNFQIKKNSNIFHISAQNIDYGYSLEPPRKRVPTIYVFEQK